MMTKNKLIIYDDEKRAAEKYKDILGNIKIVNDSFELIVYDNKEFFDIYKLLKDRRLKSREGNTDDKWNNIDVDDAAIIIIDFDLVDAHKGIPDNGEQICYYLRMFSFCNIIISINRFNIPGVKSFDLTLTGNIESQADINISNEDLKNNGLWNNEILKGFRPWHWPSLISFQKNFTKRVDDVLKNFKKPIKEFLNLGGSFFFSLSQSSLQHLGSDRENIDNTTFEDFFNNSDIILDVKDKKCNFSNYMKARITASRLSKWFERAVIPGQDVFVDCPHLGMRFPSLVEDTEIQTWNNLTKLNDLKEIPIEKKLIEKYRFNRDYWLSRPCWFWDPLSEDTEILEVKEPWKKQEIDWVFAEDASLFYPSKDCREFISGVDSQFRKRYVKHFDEVEYRKKVRLYKDE